MLENTHFLHYIYNEVSKFAFKGHFNYISVKIFIVKCNKAISSFHTHDEIYTRLIEEDETILINRKCYYKKLLEIIYTTTS